MRVEEHRGTAIADVTCVLGVHEHEVVQVRVELAAGVAFSSHQHPGDEMVYVLEGSLEYQLEDQPPVTLKAGDVLLIPAGTIHRAKNVGSGYEADFGSVVER
jgi:quercetin dioxygenase-like cupin family protein